MLYSIPGRSVIEITVETQLRLHSDCPNIIAMKEAGGNKSRVMEIRKALPQKYEVLSGDDALTVEFIKNGAIGVVSVASNIIPKKLSELVDCLLKNKVSEAEKINTFCQPLFQGLLSLDTNPIPIKEAMALCEMSTNELRLPLVGLNEANKSELVNLLTELNLLSNN
jgi:4-hydroxy-tetrahydrodipicolinate synthase